MARVQLVIPDEDRERYAHQARREGLSLSAWLRAAAQERLLRRQQTRPFRSPADVERFFRQCDALGGADTEPDWDEHLAAIDESRRRGATDT